MADIVIADDGIAFDGRTPERRPLGGAESAVVQLAEALAARGHRVRAFTTTDERETVSHNGVDWSPIHAGGPYAALPEVCDLYIANRGDALIPRVPRARRSAFWIHNPAGYIVKARYLWKLLRRRPVIVFIGDYHAATCPAWVPEGGRRVIPYGVTEAFRTAVVPALDPPAPRAVFTSNPLRGLDWLVAVWTDLIHPRVPGAELHAFSGAATYGAAGARKADAMARVLDAAGAAPGVVLRDPVPKADLIPELLSARAMLYRGDANETYCAALAEAQALGVPCVVENHGSTPERVRHGETGSVVSGRAAFADAAVAVLQDDALWRSYHDAALATQRAWSWDDAARSFEQLL
jgi:glycosyltransferase involved in cell wall biosynthesis